MHAARSVRDGEVCAHLLCDGTDREEFDMARLSQCVPDPAETEGHLEDPREPAQRQAEAEAEG